MVSAGEHTWASVLTLGTPLPPGQRAMACGLLYETDSLYSCLSRHCVSGSNIWREYRRGSCPCHSATCHRGATFVSSFSNPVPRANCADTTFPDHDYTPVQKSINRGAGSILACIRTDYAPLLVHSSYGTSSQCVHSSEATREGYIGDLGYVSDGISCCRT